MGYTTDFFGAFKLNKPLTQAQLRYLRKFSDTRRMKRDPIITSTLPDPIRKAAKLPVGEEGGYFVGATGDAGQGKDSGILDYNNPPAGQPGLWCQWTANATGKYIGWSGAEKFYNYTEWLNYLIDHFLKPWGRSLTGVVRYAGEDGDDRGRIEIVANVVTVIQEKPLAELATHTEVQFDAD